MPASPRLPPVCRLVPLSQLGATSRSQGAQQSAGAPATSQGPSALLLCSHQGPPEAEPAPPTRVTPSLDVGAGSLVTLSLRPGCSCLRGRAACPLKVCVLCRIVHEAGFSCQRRGAGGPCSILYPQPLLASFSGFVFGFFVLFFSFFFPDIILYVPRQRNTGTTNYLG